MTAREGKRRLPRASTVLAGIALFAALGGSAFAARTINGADIKKNTVTSKQIKDGTIKVRDVSKKARKRLRGNRGPRGFKGDQGETGAQGAQGAQGPAGIIAPESASQIALVTLNTDVDTLVLSKSVPQGGYVVNAKVNLLLTPTATQIACQLMSGAVLVDQILWTTPTDAANRRTSVAMQAVVASTEQLSIRCEAGGNTGSASSGKITAIPIG